MRKNVMLTTLFTAAILFGCQSEKDIEKRGTCESLDPVHEIQWLQDIIDSYQHPIRVEKYNYAGDHIVKIDFCPNCPSPYTAYYNCSGEILCQIQGANGDSGCMELVSEAEWQELLYETTSSDYNSL